MCRRRGRVPTASSIRPTTSSTLVPTPDPALKTPLTSGCRSIASSSDVYRLLPHVKSSLEGYFREQTMEPLFLFAEPFL